MADLKSSSRSRDLDKLLLRPPGHLVGPSFEPGTQLRDDLRENVRILVVGAGGLGCELLKELALSGFRNLEVIDMDRIEVSKLNRHFRLEDVGEPKAEVAAKRVMERVSGVNIVPHFCRIEEKELEFYSEFSIIVLALDSIEARSYINAVACGFLEYDSNDEPLEETVKAMVDGGFEGFKGHARVILPGITPCFECTIWPFPPQVKFPLCTLAETPITAAHCIEYAHLIKWDEVHSGKSFDPDNPEHMEWVYSEAAKRAQRFGIQGVAYSLTQGVVKNITRDIAAMYAIISAACALETLKIASGCSKTLSNYLTYNGVEGPHTTEFVKDKECLVCGPGILIELDTSVTLKMFIDQLEEHPKILMSGASVRMGGKNLYMAAPPLLEEMTRSNLGLPLFELMDKSPTGIVHVTGTAGKGDKRQSCLRKLRVVFKVVDGGIKDTDMAGGCGEEHHTSYSFHKRNNLSCMRSRNIKDRIRMQYNGVEGLHTKATEFVKDKECLVCGPGILIELDTSVTLKMFIDQLEEHPKILMSGASVRMGGKNLYMAAPPLLEEMTRSNLGLPLFELMDKSPTGIVHVTGTAGKGDKRQSCLRKLRVVFKVVDGGIKDTDMAGGA